MNKYFILILIFLSLLFPNIIAPENNSTLNTTHVLFEWEQVPDAVSYNITWVNGNNPEMLLGEENTESLIYINTEIFDWDNPYVWYVQPIFSDGSVGSYITNTDGTNHLNYFSTGTSRSNAYAIEHNSNEYSDGITLFSSFFNYYSAAIDQNGNEIWNTGDKDIVFYNTDYYGQLFGCSIDNSLQYTLPGLEFSLDGEGIWYEPNDAFLHHDLIQLPNGNYMGIIETGLMGPIPYGPWVNLFQSQGYQVNGITPEFPWVADKIVEWDKDTKEVVWEWDVFENYSMQDYDIYGDTWFQAAFDGFYDWTHINAITFSEEENAIYISCRHLSRITKIDYSTGEVIWNMGLEMPSGDVDCGQDLGFSFQHSITVLENGNILTLDNGNISVFLNNTDYPTTRALEIEVIESNNSCEASLAWSYDLSEELFGFASGNVQKLENGNYLATTVGDGGTSLEVTPNHEIVWEGKYDLSLPNGAVYRANRLSGLYPVAFSVIVEDMYLEDGNIIVDDGVSIQLHNNGYSDETFYIPLLNEDVYLNPGEIAYLNIPIAPNSEIVQIEIIPTHREDLTKQLTVYLNTELISGCTDIEACNYNPDATEDDGSCEYFNPELACDCDETLLDINGDCCSALLMDDCGVCNGANTNDLGCGCFEPAPFDCGDETFVCDLGDCEVIPGECPDGFTYFEINEIPYSTIVLDASQCFSNIDLGVLNDIIQLNNLEGLGPINLGTQNWFNDHITRLTIGNFYDGGNVSLTILPESIGNLPNIAILYLNYNELTSLPDSITNLTNLIYLVLSFNQLTHLPDNIGNWNNMIWLDLGYNSIEYLPDSIGDFSIIQYLWIFNNQLSSLPNSICNLSLDWSGLDNNFLPYFGSGGNMLCGGLPECIANSENINTSIDPLYYSFLITVEQDCSECGQVDISNDGIVNVIDIVSLVNFILSEENTSDENLCTFDLTGDGVINVIDIVLLVNTILDN